jgi:hypothetical protein
MNEVIQLTEEQRQAVAAHQGRPVEVVDPVTRRSYMLIAAETYQRVRDVLEAEDTPAQTAGSAPSPSAPAAPPLAEGRPMRQRLRDLATTPEVAEEIRRYCKHLGLSRKKSREWVEEDLKLQYYFGGRYVGYLETEEGKVIVAAGRLDSEEFGRQLDAVSPEERRKVKLFQPFVWDDPVSQLRTPFTYED